MKEMVTLNKKEQRRLMVLNEVETDKMTSRVAAEVLGLYTELCGRFGESRVRFGAVLAANCL